MLRNPICFRSLLCLSWVSVVSGVSAAPIVSYDLTGTVPTMNVDLNVGAASVATLHITPDEFQLNVNGSDYAWPTPDSDPNYAIAIHGSDHPDDLLVTKSLSDVGFDLLVGFVGNGGADTFDNNTDYTAIAYGGPGDDHLSGGPATDYLVGDAGADICQGGGGDDVLSGGPGPDQLFGQLGDDYLMGDATLTTSGPAIPDEPQADGSVDTLIGGLGADTFVENYYVDVDVENPYAVDNLLVEQDEVVDAGRGDTVLDWEVDMPVWGIEGTFPEQGRDDGGSRLTSPKDSRQSPDGLSTKG